jgi:hypothetical protein
MKAEADIDFIMGENQLIFHGWPYSPPDHKVPEPGWSLYAAAVFNDHNPWHPVMPAVTQYIARISYLMRQGQPANQVAILLPTDDAWASFTPAHVTVTGAMQRLITPALMSAILSAGYNVDFIDAEAINKVGLGTHQILVLPPTDRIPVETLRKIHDFAAHNGKVIAVGHVPTMDPEGKSSPELTHLTEAIAVVPDYEQLGHALHAAIKPDFQVVVTANDNADEQIGFIRRRLPNGDIYFVANTSNQPVVASVKFASKFKHAELWDTDTGAYGPVGINKYGLDLNLPPYGSAVYVFSDAPGPDSVVRTSSETPIADLSTDWKVTFASTGKTQTEPALTDWTADPTTLHYSGEATYIRDFTLTTRTTSPIYLEVEGGHALPGAPNSPPEHPVLGPNGLPDPRITRPGPGMHAYFNPPIHEAALVTINGQPAGALWHPPYRLDVSKLLKPGQNHIEIHVFNTALNAWSALPPHDYKPLIAKYGDRFQMQDLNKVEPISSGILGKIHLVTESGQ